MPLLQIPPCTATLTGRRLPASRRVPEPRETASRSSVPAAYNKLPPASRTAASSTVPAGRVGRQGGGGERQVEVEQAAFGELRALGKLHAAARDHQVAVERLLAGQQQPALAVHARFVAGQVQRHEAVTDAAIHLQVAAGAQHQVAYLARTVNASLRRQRVEAGVAVAGQVQVTLHHQVGAGIDRGDLHTRAQVQGLGVAGIVQPGQAHVEQLAVAQQVVDEQHTQVVLAGQVVLVDDLDRSATGRGAARRRVDVALVADHGDGARAENVHRTTHVDGDVARRIAAQAWGDQLQRAALAAIALPGGDAVAQVDACAAGQGQLALAAVELDHGTRHVDLLGLELIADHQVAVLDLEAARTEHLVAVQALVEAGKVVQLPGADIDHPARVRDLRAGSVVTATGRAKDLAEQLDAPALLAQGDGRQAPGAVAAGTEIDQRASGLVNIAELAAQHQLAAPAVLGHVIEGQGTPGQVQPRGVAQAQVVQRLQGQAAAGQAEGAIDQQLPRLQAQLGAQGLTTAGKQATAALHAQGATGLDTIERAGAAGPQRCVHQQVTTAIGEAAVGLVVATAVVDQQAALVVGAHLMAGVQFHAAEAQGLARHVGAAIGLAVGAVTELQVLDTDCQQAIATAGPARDRRARGVARAAPDQPFGANGRPVAGLAMAINGRHAEHQRLQAVLAGDRVVGVERRGAEEVQRVGRRQGQGLQCRHSLGRAALQQAVEHLLVEGQALAQHAVRQGASQRVGTADVDPPDRQAQVPGPEGHPVIEAEGLVGGGEQRAVRIQPGGALATAGAATANQDGARRPAAGELRRHHIQPPIGHRQQGTAVAVDEVAVIGIERHRASAKGDDPGPLLDDDAATRVVVGQEHFTGLQHRPRTQPDITGAFEEGHLVAALAVEHIGAAAQGQPGCLQGIELAGRQHRDVLATGLAGATIGHHFETTGAEHRRAAGMTAFGGGEVHPTSDAQGTGGLGIALHPQVQPLAIGLDRRARHAFGHGIGTGERGAGSAAPGHGQAIELDPERPRQQRKAGRQQGVGARRQAWNAAIQGDLLADPRRRHAGLAGHRRIRAGEARHNGVDRVAAQRGQDQAALAIELHQRVVAGVGGAATPGDEAGAGQRAASGQVDQRVQQGDGLGAPRFLSQRQPAQGRAQHTALLDPAGDQRQPAEHRERLVGCALPGPADAQGGVAARLDLAEGAGGRVDLRSEQFQVGIAAQQGPVGAFADLGQYPQVALAAQAAKGKTTAVEVQYTTGGQRQAAMGAEGHGVTQVQQVGIDLQQRRAALRRQPTLEGRPGRLVGAAMVTAGKPHIGRLQVDAGVAGAPLGQHQRAGVQLQAAGHAQVEVAVERHHAVAEQREAVEAPCVDPGDVEPSLAIAQRAVLDVGRALGKDQLAGSLDSVDQATVEVETTIQRHLQAAACGAKATGSSAEAAVQAQPVARRQADAPAVAGHGQRPLATDIQRGLGTIGAQASALGHVQEQVGAVAGTLVMVDLPADDDAAASVDPPITATLRIQGAERPPGHIDQGLVTQADRALVRPFRHPGVHGRQPLLQQADTAAPGIEGTVQAQLRGAGQADGLQGVDADRRAAPDLKHRRFTARLVEAAITRRQGQARAGARLQLAGHRVLRQRRRQHDQRRIAERPAGVELLHRPGDVDTAAGGHTQAMVAGDGVMRETTVEEVLGQVHAGLALRAPPHAHPLGGHGQGARTAAAVTAQLTVEAHPPGPGAVQRAAVQGQAAATATEQAVGFAAYHAAGHVHHAAAVQQHIAAAAQAQAATTADIQAHPGAHADLRAQPCRGGQRLVLQAGENTLAEHIAQGHLPAPGGQVGIDLDLRGIEVAVDCQLATAPLSQRCLQADVGALPPGALAYQHLLHDRGQAEAELLGVAEVAGQLLADHQLRALGPGSVYLAIAVTPAYRRLHLALILPGLADQLAIEQRALGRHHQAAGVAAHGITLLVTLTGGNQRSRSPGALDSS
ncbi:hypothetical protein WR25_09610 [Diploscapter pachys]|uniref:Uncharacterized protein n=1 Tax=Diploscapter pachys TaxID=2018661 RepID=A0A2A2K082_9BILA|nr:hypothetical protein WR25_09610 [Diploscapter pachys]